MKPIPGLWSRSYRDRSFAGITRVTVKKSGLAAKRRGVHEDIGWSQHWNSWLRGKNILFVIANPDVHKAQSSDT